MKQFHTFFIGTNLIFEAMRNLQKYLIE